MAVEKIFVIGAGFMGSGIAQVCAQAGYAVQLTDIQPAITERALDEIRWSVGKLATKGVLKEAPEQILARLRPETGLGGAAQADWVIEAAWEEYALKCELFAELDRTTSPTTVIATNSSSIPVTRLAANARHPERMLGLHFFGPVPLMQAVEVVRGEQTDQAVFERVVGGSGVGQVFVE